jgi:pimeloyl-ACP methyl ester carboxylesterase
MTPCIPPFPRACCCCRCRRDFVRDFLVGVVGRPAVLAGNSIGGFISASAAADYPELVAGLALVNTCVGAVQSGGGGKSGDGRCLQCCILLFGTPPILQSDWAGCSCVAPMLLGCRLTDCQWVDLFAIGCCWVADSTLPMLLPPPLRVAVLVPSLQVSVRLRLLH